MSVRTESIVLAKLVCTTIDVSLERAFNFRSGHQFFPEIFCPVLRKMLRYTQNKAPTSRWTCLRAPQANNLRLLWKMQVRQMTKNDAMLGNCAISITWQPWGEGVFLLDSPTITKTRLSETEECFNKRQKILSSNLSTSLSSDLTANKPIRKISWRMLCPKRHRVKK